MYYLKEILEWLVHNRARKIQWTFLERLQVKVKALTAYDLHCRHDIDFRNLFITTHTRRLPSGGSLQYILKVKSTKPRKKQIVK